MPNSLITLYRLPNELIALILANVVQSCRVSKNQVIRLRLVDKLFDAILRPCVFKTIQLEFSKLLTGQAKDLHAIHTLKEVGPLCQAVYCDMMVIRDEDEIDRLMSVFSSLFNNIPETRTLATSLCQFAMRKDTFDEDDFQRIMRDLFSYAPNVTRLKLNLPFQVIGKCSHTATILLATAFASVASRAPEHKALQVLVVDQVSDSTVLHICNNPVDLANARHSFSGLKSIVLSLKRQENQLQAQENFSYHFWDLIGHATQLQSLCITGWNSKRHKYQRVQTPERHIEVNDWLMKSLPYPTQVDRRLKSLRYLELSRVDMDPQALIRMIDDMAASLKELYLNEVHLKIRGPGDEPSEALWIGHAPEESKPPSAIWVAEYLREHETLHLDILRASNLGYDEYSLPALLAPPPAGSFDIEDPSHTSRPFDLRFVERATRTAPPPPSTAPPRPVPKHLYEVGAYQKTAYARPPAAPLTCRVQSERLDSCRPLRTSLAALRGRNTTSHFKSSIDGIFFNHNEGALNELQKIIAAVDRSMTMMGEEIDRIGREAGRARGQQEGGGAV